MEESLNGIVPFDFFSDGMVLQRNAVNKIYGTANYDGGGAEFPDGYSQENYGSADKELAMLNAFSALGRANQQLLPNLIENCAVTVSHNTGDFDDIHPSDKTVIAYQAACNYLKDLYKFKEETLLYPTLNGVLRIDGGVKLTFNNLCGGLIFKNYGRGFQVSEDGVNYKQVVAEKDGNCVCLYASAAGISKINYVRYGWIEYPRVTRVDVEKYVSIFNSYGMPLDQFETAVSD